MAYVPITNRHLLLHISPLGLAVSLPPPGPPTDSKCISQQVVMQQQKRIVPRYNRSRCISFHYAVLATQRASEQARHIIDFLSQQYVAFNIWPRV
jgi:hypothetical protein